MDYMFDMELRDVCARRIQASWRSYQDRKLFGLLMSTMQSVERCLGPAVLGQLSPREAHLLRDPSVQCKVKFRFSGPQFPPVVVFKIFHTGRGGRYISGKKLFHPISQATAETCRMMGNKRFMDLMMEDEVHWQGRTISDPAHITCVRDYIQFSSHLDELPAYLGGRENGWRCLSLNLLRRDGGSGKVKGLFRNKHLGLGGETTPPVRSPVTPPPSAVSASIPCTTRRRSARAISKTNHMRRIYTLKKDARVTDGELDDKTTRRPDKNNNQMNKEDWSDEKITVHMCLDDGVSDVPDWDWEKEAEQLCSWSNQLTLDHFDLL